MKNTVHVYLKFFESILEDLIRFSDQYKKALFQFNLKQLIRANELEKYASLKNRINELNHYFFNENFK